jgi:uncharacterized protein YbaR (Trm112 family)
VTVPQIPPAIRELLACPRCHGPLLDGPPGRPEESATLHCAACALRFPVRDGIPVLLLDQARTEGP